MNESSNNVTISIDGANPCLGQRESKSRWRTKILGVISVSVIASTVAVFAVKSQRTTYNQNSTRKLQSGGSDPIDLGIDLNEISEEDRSRLPSVDEVTDLYGPEPVILGLDRCERFQNDVPPEDRFLGIAGLYNTGTNFLYKTLSENCIIPGGNERFRKHGGGELQRGILSGVPWGKHAPLLHQPSKIMGNYENLGYLRFTSMPVVIVKDPVFWMSSMCRRWYDVVSITSDRNWYDRCPYLTSDDLGTSIPIRGRLAPWQEKFEYDSLVDLWNSFYGPYEEFLAPRLILRYEDLIFHGDKVVRDVCACAGGEVRDFNPFSKSTKEQVLDKEGHANGLVQSAILYGSKVERSRVFKTERDRAFAEKNLNADLLSKLRYHSPVDVVMSHQDDEWKPKIPHIIWFIGQQQILTEPYFANVVATIDTYKEAWDEPDAVVNFLSDEDCLKAVEEVIPKIKDAFESDTDEEFKATVCKIAVLYKYGGYYFSTDVQAVQAFRPRDDVSFVSPVSCGDGGCLLSSAFMASGPEQRYLQLAIKVITETYQVRDVFDAPVLLQKRMEESYHGLAEERKFRAIQLLEEKELGMLSYEADPLSAEVERQDGHGNCNVVIRDAKLPEKILFYSHFLGSQKCAFGRIPRKLWFTHRNTNILQTGLPVEEVESIQNLIQGYRTAWDEPEIFVGNLSDEFCLAVVKDANEELYSHYSVFEDQAAKNDMCRLSIMYVHGGLFFGERVEENSVGFVPSNNMEFVATSESNARYLSGTGFAAVIPRHIVIRRAINLVLEEMNTFTTDEMPRVLAKAFHSILPRYRGEVLLLEEDATSEVQSVR